MKKIATGLLSMNKPNADERSPTQLGKDDAKEYQTFFGGDSFRDIGNSNAGPDINETYKSEELSQKDLESLNDGEDFFDMIGLTGAVATKGKISSRIPNKISSRET